MAASGDQFEINADGYRAVVTQAGATLRVLEHNGRPLIAGFRENVHADAGRGQLLLPWPNRLEDGNYSFHGRRQQLPLTDVARRSANHGLVRWAPWALQEAAEHSVSLRHRLMAQQGYPWMLEVNVRYTVSADGLTVTVAVTNLSDSSAPFALGAHPYLTVGEGRLDRWELTVPASTRLVLDSVRKLPIEHQDVSGTAHDFRLSRPLRGVVLDDAYTNMTRGSNGTAVVQLVDPRTEAAVSLWMDQSHTWVHLYSGDDLPYGARTSLAVEPMTAPPNAFRSGHDLIALAPAGSDSDQRSFAWGIVTD